MKRFIIFLLLYLPLALNGQNYFRDGMKWVSYAYGTHTPEPNWSVEEVTLEKCPGKDYYIMNIYGSNPSDPKSLYIRTDGDKVYFKYDDYISPEWYLLYDFGLRPGEGCYVYSANPSCIKPNTPNCTYVKCTGISEGSGPGGWDMMLLEGYLGDTCVGIYEQGTWIKGLSSPAGVLDNLYFVMSGKVSQLTEVSDNGTVIFSNPLSGKTDITDSISPDIRILGSEVFVTTGQDIRGSVYSQSGALIGDYGFSDVPTCISLPERGIYILSISGFPIKIVIP